MNDEGTHISDTAPQERIRLPDEGTREERLRAWINTKIESLGFEAIAIELFTQREGRIRLYIDHLSGEGRVSVDDCATVSRALDEPLDLLEDLDQWFSGGYELEVSSPGIERPLVAPKDFRRFSGARIRVSTYSPLSADQLRNPDYFEKNPKQKNFVGKLVEFSESEKALRLEIEQEVSSKKKKKKKEPVATEAPQVWIPLDRIAKAHLNPHLDALIS